MSLYENQKFDIFFIPPKLIEKSFSCDYFSKVSNVEKSERCFMSFYPQEAWVVKTGQTWKMNIGFFLTFSGIFLKMALIWKIKMPILTYLFDSPWVLDNIWMILFFIGAYFFFLVKCSKCKKSAFFYILKTEHFGQNHVGLLMSIKACPYCSPYRSSSPVPQPEK